MSEHGGKTSRPWDPQRSQHEAHSPASKLPEGDLVFFLLDAVARLDVSRFYAPYEQETRGAPPFDPAMMVCLLLSAYSVGGGRAAKSPGRVNVLWPFWRSWVRIARTFALSVTFARDIWECSKRSLCRWCV